MSHPYESATLAETADVLIIANRPGAASLIYAILGTIVQNDVPDQERDALAALLRENGARRAAEAGHIMDLSNEGDPE